ncbi:Rha family transcriptional regulator [Klebsiella pneumoniae]|uniref:Rha family transcriptional regulator n=1 Tax=Klebsiella pneumoniae TaxID=573 RepID=UPI00313E5A21
MISHLGLIRTFPKYMVKKEKNKGRVSLRYLMYKTDQVRESLGHSNFRVIVGK